MTCQKCKNVFDAELVVNAPIEVAIASMKAVSCPQCGAREVGMGGEHKGVPPLNAPLEVRVDWWWERGERGTSSETIFCAMTGRGLRRASYPLDPDDYRRCRRLLEIVPEWRGQLSKVVDRFPWFEPFATFWDRFDTMWDAEYKTGRCPMLYEEMQKACAAAERIKEMNP
jgi:hypothetical protein